MPPEPGGPSKSVDVYLGASRWLRRGIRAVGGTFNGLWLGVLSDAALDAVDTSYYDGRDSYRDASYNERGLFEWESVAIGAHFGECRRVVVTAAGGGREVLALRERGFDARGFECNAGLVHAGRRLLADHGHEGTIEVCARHEWPTNEPFDGVVVGWGSYMLIRGRQRRVAFLRGAARSLPKGGPLLVSFFGRDRLGAEFRLITALGNAIRTLAGRELLELGDTLVPNYVHVFTEDAIESELRDGGFELVAYERTPYRHAIARRL